MSSAPPPTPVPVRRVNVFEVLNRSRLSSLLVVSTESAEELGRRLRRSPPAVAAGWDLSRDLVDVELLMPRMPEGAADEFLVLYLENMRKRTWRFHIWRP